MNIFVSGINYKTTPLEIREKLCLNAEQQKLLLQEIQKLSCVDECVVLSTCNRTEVYVCSETEGFEIDEVEKLLCKIKGLSIYDVKKYFYVYTGSKSVKHLFRVACGLDSMVLGEDQILGQIKSAYELALDMQASSGVLNTLFRDAVTAAKKVKTRTGLSQNSLSVSTLAVKLVNDIFSGDLSGKCTLVIGAGKIGSIALKNMVSKGIGKVYVTNRTHYRADGLSKGYGNVVSVDYNRRYSVIDECDIVISSTSSPHYTITRDMLEKSITNVKQRIFVDLAVPRDFDVSIKEIQGVKYFDIDDLQAVADKNLDKRMAETERAEEIIREYVAEYERWYEFRSVLPIVKDIQRFTNRIVNEKVNQMVVRLKSVSDEERELVIASITGTVNSILNKFIYSVRERASKDDIQAYFRCLKEVMKDG